MASHRTSTAVYLGLTLGLLMSGLERSASADVAIITDHHGPVMGASAPLTILPYYVGSAWGDLSNPSPAVKAHQAYLAKVAEFISGKYLPPGVVPFTRQYRVVAGANVGPIAGDTTLPQFRALSNADIRSIIVTAQGQTGIRRLGSYGPNVLVMVFPSSDFVAGPNSCARNALSVAYHCDDGPNRFFGVYFGSNWVVSESEVSLTVSHEVLEAATDPKLGTAWMGSPGSPNREICDIDMNSNGFSYDGVQIASCFDNSLGGAQTTTGCNPPVAFDPVSFNVPRMILLF